MKRFLLLVILLSLLSCLWYVHADESAAKNDLVTLRCMTYNILWGAEPRKPEDFFGTGQKLHEGNRIELLVSIIREQRPDIVFLQECNGWDKENNKILKQVAKKTNMHSLLAPTNSGFHVALLSKYPILANTTYDLKTPFAHNLLVARLKLPNGKIIQAASVHYGWWGVPGFHQMNKKEQNDSYRKQTALFLDDLRKYTKEPLIIGGDFNHMPNRGHLDVPPLYNSIVNMGYSDAWVAANGKYPKTMRTLSTEEQGIVIDFIFLSPALNESAKVKRCEILANPKTFQTSDHLPILAEIEIR
jgi:endonuclease/exonuclease/phosphatase family metal-dependent hydrolase